MVGKLSCPDPGIRNWINKIITSCILKGNKFIFSILRSNKTCKYMLNVNCTRVKSLQDCVYKSHMIKCLIART